MRFLLSISNLNRCLSIGLYSDWSFHVGQHSDDITLPMSLFLSFKFGLSFCHTLFGMLRDCVTRGEQFSDEIVRFERSCDLLSSWWCDIILDGFSATFCQLVKAWSASTGSRLEDEECYRQLLSTLSTKVLFCDSTNFWGALSLLAWCLFRERYLSFFGSRFCYCVSVTGFMAKLA